MAEEKIENALKILFQRAKMSSEAKARVKKRVFCDAELSDNDLSFVAAAGEPAQQGTETADLENFKEGV